MMMALTDTRWRPRNGTPRTTLERITQWAWCYRKDIMLGYMVCCWSAAIGWWITH